MVKIIVTYNGLIQQELSLLKPRITIGRRPSNDVVIDHLTVSGQHAAIDTSLQGSFILDLGSTNGTMINGQPIKKHMLQNDDVIDIGKYKLRVKLEPDQPVRQALPPLKANSLQSAAALPAAKIKVLTGANAGRELVLNKPVTTLGSPGVLVAAITRQEHGYYIAHVEGAAFPKVNERAIDGQPMRLTDGDVIDFSGTRMAFSLEAA
ncbi:FHA domain-containing protein [Undibacterium sp. TJN25]|uniref:FHA domain-containing protein n=1 Tax=Undibacterium sp. TJN25 TaxID=3413056 RepID=UPI003BF24A31